MQNDKASLAALIGSRICHDLISPIGAIANGLELVAMTAPTLDSPEMTLIHQSCDNAAARIRFFRIAFGSAGDRQGVPCTQVEKTLSDHYDGTRFETSWNSPDEVPRNVVQLGFLAALCLEASLPQGGRIAVTVGAQEISCTATGPVAQQDAAIWAHLMSPGGDHMAVSPAQVQFALLGHLCNEAGLLPQVSASEGHIVLTLPLPGLPQ